MIPFIASIFGLISGSFLNVCIYRWPRDESVVTPRSHCPNCDAIVTWRDNIPLLSYVLLKGRCRHCGEHISIIYPTVELLNAAFYGYLFWRGGLDPMTFKLAIFTSMMLVLIFTDLTEYILPDEITVGGLLVALVFIPIVPVEDRFTGIIWLFVHRPSQWIVSATESIFSAAFVGGLLYGMRSAYFRMRKIEGLGLGDVKMMAMVAAFWGLGAYHHDSDVGLDRGSNHRTDYHRRDPQKVAARVAFRELPWGYQHCGSQSGEKTS